MGELIKETLGVSNNEKSPSIENLDIKKAPDDASQNNKEKSELNTKKINRRTFLKGSLALVGSSMVPKSAEAGISIFAEISKDEELFNEKIPLERQFKQGRQSDCQTVAALKQIALLEPERLKEMITKNQGGDYIVNFPKIDNYHGLWNFDESLTTVEVSKDDIKHFRSWYGESGGLAQDVIYSSLIKRMWNADKYPPDSRDLQKIPENKKNFQSVKEYIDYLNGLKTMFFGETKKALEVLTGESFKTNNIELQAKRRLFLIPEQNLNENEKQEKQKYIKLMRELFEAKKIWAASQHYGYISDDKYKPYEDFVGKDVKNNKDANEDGVIEGHTYALKYNEADDTVTLFNPWNKYEPESGINFDNDGKFTLSLNEFLKKFSTFVFKQDENNNF